EHMKLCIDRAFNFSAPSDILFFHEFPITGFKVWTRKEALRVAIEIPGEETEQIAAKAKEYGCYIVFGSYAQDKDWPNHLLSITTIINPKGEVIAKHWKARNIKGVFPGIELYTTTIYDVLDRYVEMYGEDELIPITRTPIGNIATSSVQREPELFRAFAMKGAEIMLRTATGGFTPIDIQACAMYNGFYTAIVNNAVSPDNGLFFESSGSTGGSAIYDPRGNEMAHAGTQMETSVGANIPIGAYRQRNRQPFVHMDLYRHVFDKYRNAYPPNLMAGEELPKDIYDAKKFFKGKSVWK
ncbi:MAG: nitrilase-related carbon-nitrogen hydrolase, partial [Bacteroidota bacterium]